MKKTLLFILTLSATSTLFAQIFKSGGINYSITSIASPLTVEVSTNASFTGVANIPASVTNGNNTYTVTSIGDNAFYNCSGLTSVTIPNSVTSIGLSAFYNCLGLTSFIIPNSVTSINQSAFESCKGITSVTIPNSVTNIGVRVFRSCTGLTSFNIPKSITSIQKYAFEDCSGLNSITVNWSTPLSIIPSVFDGPTLPNITLYVPVGTETAYKSTAVWKDFKSITTLGTNNFEIANNFKIYPNPTNSFIDISTITENYGSLKLGVFDNLGKHLKTNIINSKIDFSKFQNGVYYLKFEYENQIITKKIIKQ